jgi:hypothetical protein
MAGNQLSADKEEALTNLTMLAYGSQTFSQKINFCSLSYSVCGGRLLWQPKLTKTPRKPGTKCLECQPEAAAVGR